MDTFIDKLTQKKTAQEMIRANAAAEAARMEQMQSQLQAYEKLMQESAAAEAARMEQMQSQLQAYEKLIQESAAVEKARMERMQQQMNAYDETMQEIRRVNLKTAGQVDQVQQALALSIEKLEEADAGSAQEKEAARQLSEIKDSLASRFGQSEEFMHKESVKVYRNVQEAFKEELAKQEQARKGGSAPLWLSIVILFGVLANLAVNVAQLLLQMWNMKLF